MKIIFYDGHCPMCNGWVKRLIRWDKKKQFRFSPLEGELAKTTLTSLFPEYLKEDTIVFFDEGQIYLRSDAAIMISKTLGFPFSLGKVGQFIPIAWRDGVYRWVANRRYQFGQRYDSCPVPPLEWRDRFV